MKVLGIIAEYNPFHNGHAYQLSKCRALADADYVVAVLGSDFNQRGTPAIVNKYVRTAMALNSGIDLVIELPQFASCASASYFADSGVSLLSHLGVTTHIGFGCESGDLDTLMQISEILSGETPEFSALIQSKLKQGCSYAAARDAAIFSGISQSVKNPNDILAIEYINALNLRQSNIIPVAVKREGMAYHEISLNQALGQNTNANTDRLSENAFFSATAIRKETVSCMNLELALQNTMPACALQIYLDHLKQCRPITPDDFYPLLRLSLISCTALTEIFDINEDFAHRLNNFKNQYGSLEAWVGSIKSKNYTWSKVSRSLTHIMLRQTKTAADLMKSMDNAPYVRFLGFKKSAAPLLKAIKNNCDLPIISKMADAKKILNGNACTLFENNVCAARIYKAVEQTHTSKTLRDEYCESPVIIA